MLIGIDASRSYGAAPTGTEVYSREITSALLRSGSTYQFRLYTRAIPPPELCPPCGDYEIRTIPFPRLWTHLRLSAEMIAHSPDALIVPSHVLPLAHPRRSLVTVHDLGYLHFPQAHLPFDRFYLDLSTRWNVRTAVRVIVDSNATLQDLVRFYNVNPEKILVVHPAPPGSFNHPMPGPDEIAQVKRRHQIVGEYLIAIGTIHPRKNYERLFETFQGLAENYQLVIIGKKGWLFQEILASAEKLQVAGRIKFLDYVADADLPSLYSGSRLCVFPSLYEGFGFPILEAQACGTPVVCSNTSSLPEVAGDAAEFFDPLDVRAISNAISRVLHNGAHRAELVAKGTANLKRFSWTHAANEILAAIASV